MGADMEPARPEDLARLQDAIRAHNTAEIQSILTALKPQIDGSYGPVNPRLIEVYFKGLSEIARLYRVYDPPPPRPEDKPVDRLERELRATAERQLQELADRAEPG